MSSSRLCATLVAFITLTSCTPSALQWQLLSPVPSPSTITAFEIYSADPANRENMPQNAERMVVVTADSVAGGLTMYEFEDVFWLDVYVENAGSQPFSFGPSDVVLLDGARFQLRQMEPHEAANLYAAQVRGIPPYQPKYVYNATSSSAGYIQLYGDYAYYTGTTQTTVTQQPDPYHQLGYSIGAALARKRNEQFLSMAGSIYAVGFVEGASIAGKANARGGIFWLKPQGWQGPLTLRFVDTGYEVQFAPN